MTLVQLIDFKKIIESLYCVVLCCVALHGIVLCCVGLCWAMLCYVVLCYAMLCYVVLCCAMSCHVIHMSCHTHVMPCHVMSCHVMYHLHVCIYSQTDVFKINLFFVTGRLNAWYIIRWQPYTLEYGGTQVFIKRTSLSGSKYLLIWYWNIANICYTADDSVNDLSIFTLEIRLLSQWYWWRFFLKCFGEFKRIVIH